MKLEVERIVERFQCRGPVRYGLLRKDQQRYAKWGMRKATPESIMLISSKG